jgi:hypothetical protein
VNRLVASRSRCGGKLAGVVIASASVVAALDEVGNDSAEPVEVDRLWHEGVEPRMCFSVFRTRSSST